MNNVYKLPILKLKKVIFTWNVTHENLIAPKYKMPLKVLVKCTYYAL